MKIIYTQEEINSLSQEELNDLFTFGTSNNRYFYSDIKKMDSSTSEKFIELNDGNILYTKTENTFLEVQQGKIRFDLLSSIFSANKDANNVKEEFYTSITESVQASNSSTRSTVQSLEKKLLSTIDSIESRLDSIAKKYEEKMKAIEQKNLKTYNNKLKQLDQFSIDTYNVKMEKLDKILSAFDDLIEG